MQECVESDDVQFHSDDSRTVGTGYAVVAKDFSQLEVRFQSEPDIPRLQMHDCFWPMLLK